VRQIIEDGDRGGGGGGGDGRGGGGGGAPPEAEETVACAGFEGRVIGKGGATINKLHTDTGARINIDKGSGECVVTGSTAQVMAAVAAIRRVIEEGDEGGGGRGGGRRRENDDGMPPSRPEGDGDGDDDDDGEPMAPPIEPDFGISGLLAAETNTVHGVTLVYTEPPEARKPTLKP
jgi:smad nuclear-interacting protein 1